MTNSLLLCLDIVLALTLVAIALRVLLTHDLFQSIVLFIIFGMLLGIAWCRLEAVDVALAEVALGAGLTGALLLNTWSVTRRQEAQPNGNRPAPAEAKAPWAPIAVACAAVSFVTVLVVTLATVVAPLAQADSGPGIAVGEALPQSGVSNTVTAVLLNFRAHDTLLEVAVLVAAVLAALTVSTNVRPTGARRLGPVLSTFARLLVPLAILVAVYVLWAGTKAPGGAFQAAAIVGAAGVLTSVCGSRPPNYALRRWRALLVSGPMVFLLVGWGGVVAGGRFLELPPRWAGPLIMLIETALTASIALVLVLLFSGTTSSAGEHGTAAEVEEEFADTADAGDSGPSLPPEQSP